MTQPIYLGKGYQDDDVVAEYYAQQKEKPERTLEQLAAIQKLYKFIYDTVQICSIDQKGVHLTPEGFTRLFQSWTTKETTIEEYPTRLEAVYDNTLFFCLMPREEKNHDQ